MSKQVELTNSSPNQDKTKTAPPRIEQVSFKQLFRFATPLDWFMMITGSIGSAIDGAAMPLFALLLGNVANDFGPGHSDKQIFDAAVKICWEFICVAVGSWIVSYFGFAFWMITGERQAIEVRKRYFKSLLSQEIAFFDSINPNEMSTKIAEECLSIQQGIGEKVPTFVYSIAMMVIGFLIGYIKGWQLALVMTACVPIIGLTGAVFVMSMQKVTRINNEAYARAGAIAEEALNAIRTIVSLGGQEKETRRYKDVMSANRYGIYKYSIMSGVAMGLLFMSLYGVFALGFYIGAVFVHHNVYNPVSNGPYRVGDVLTVFFSILMASFTPARAVPSIKAFAVAKIGAAKAYKVIDRKSQISIENSGGEKLARIEGNINFSNVVFAYPLKPDRTILKGANFQIRKNEKTALVGESGCGKTTCIQLIERFYDLLENNGSITLDGKELKNLNLKWLRENIGYVGQEPVLFATSVRENLMMAKEDATDDEIWQALKRANAYDFVQSLPEKLDTFVGNQGTQLSGGQKQRLAIARAILKNPSILLLDEATSALDRKNEMEIQKTLDEISEGRTTIVIAHRLSTIINSDHIIVFDQGVVVEEGRHAELIEKRGRYYALQHMQLQAEDKEKEKEKEKTEPQQKTIAPESNVRKVSQGKKAKNDEEVPIVTIDNGKSRQEHEVPIKKEPTSSVLRRLLRYNHQDIHLIVIGVFAGLVHGLNTPMNAILLANMIGVLAQPQKSNFMDRSQYFALLFMANAITALLSNAVQTSCFNIVSENLSRKVRAEVFEKYVRMPIGWFDDPRNSPGVLGSRLTTDATLINTLTGSVFGVYVQAASSFVCGLIIGFIASWQLTLVGLGLSPLMVISGKIRAKFSQSYNNATDEYYQESIAFVSEAVNNMRTVASFGKEGKLFDNYCQKLDVPLKAATKNGHLSGFAFGIGQFLNFLVYAIVFLVGGKFMASIDLDFKDMFQSVLGVMFAAMGMGNALQFAPDVGAAQNAAIHIFKVLDTVPAINIDDPNQTYRKPIKGDIEFRNIWFKYPSREKQIFSGMNLKIDASTKVALVGPSGCGKSTILALLQRFYDPDQGEVLIDGVNIKEFDLKFLRESFGVVSQEPVLFNGTIEYNIKYSKENATDEEMRQAAIKASALGFIENNEFDVAGDDAQAAAKFGTGFKRKVGPKGSQMSGGQKQRIAIARAIMKNPSLLILDEATSALDVQNEKIVQESLDKIMGGKTSVIVAHRISTIKDADQIVVFNEGSIVEKGTYSELNDMKGLFYKLERGLSTA